MALSPKDTAKAKAKAGMLKSAGFKTGKTTRVSSKSTTGTGRRLAEGSTTSGLDPFPPVLEVNVDVLARVVNEQRAIKVLGAAMASAPEPVSPELARSVQAEENWWRKVERDLPALGSSEVAWFLGAKPNRNLASSMRAAGKLLGYARRNAIRYPKIQFDVEGRGVLPVIPDLIAIARECNVSDEDLVLWLVSPTAFFAEQNRPMDHLDDPERLLAAARDEFGSTW